MLTDRGNYMQVADVETPPPAEESDAAPSEVVINVSEGIRRLSRCFLTLILAVSAAGTGVIAGHLMEEYIGGVWLGIMAVVAGFLVVIRACYRLGYCNVRLVFDPVLAGEEH